MPGHGSMPPRKSGNISRSSGTGSRGGSLAELIQDRFERENDIIPMLGELAKRLKTNRSYLP